MSKPKLLETPMTRREALQAVGCLVCMATFTGFAQEEEMTPTRVVLEGELLKAEDYKFVLLGDKDVVVYASATEIPQSLVWGNVWLVAYSRYCTHKGTTIDEPIDGIMTCPKHGQEYDTSTGAPIGEKHKTEKSLKAYKLELQKNTVWITGVLV
jgi:nitrite reductase/ring-hydroxylating ferredoxin subunit